MCVCYISAWAWLRPAQATVAHQPSWLARILTNLAGRAVVGLIHIFGGAVAGLCIPFGLAGCKFQVWILNKYSLYQAEYLIKLIMVTEAGNRGN